MNGSVDRMTPESGQEYTANSAIARICIGKCGDSYLAPSQVYCRPNPQRHELPDQKSMITHRLKLLFIILSCVLISACAAQTSPFVLDRATYAGVIDSGAESHGTLIRKRAREVYDLNYTVGVNHRAIAQSTTGVWGWTQKQPTLDMALDRALELCRNRNQSNEAEAPSPAPAGRFLYRRLFIHRGQCMTLPRIWMANLANVAYVAIGSS